MPWDVDIWLGGNADLRKDRVSLDLKTTSILLAPSPSSRLFTIPQEILINVLDRLTKKDAFQLSQTCKSFMQSSAVMEAVFREPISLGEINKWYGHLDDYEKEKNYRLEKVVGPPITWGINASTGPFVRRMVLPEWTSEQDIQHLITHCPNLDSVDLSEIFESVPWQQEGQSDEDDDEEKESIHSFPSFFDRCPAFFQKLRSVDLPYGCWRGVHNRPFYGGWIDRIAMLPKALSLAEHLQSLTIYCQPISARGVLPDTRRKASAMLLRHLLDHVSEELTTLALHDSVCTIDNLDRFMKSLTVFPKLRTIKLSLYGDLHMYQKSEHYLNDLDSLFKPILSCRTKEYQYDTASVLQYLSVIKRINEKGRFSVVPIDKDAGYIYLPCEFYGLCQKELVHGLWSPVWSWADRMRWVSGHGDTHGVETVDMEKCRALFGELIKADVCVSVELRSRLHRGCGALFATEWVDKIVHRCYDQEGNLQGESVLFPPSDKLLLPDSWDRRQHFIQRDSTGITSKSGVYRYETPAPMLSADLEPVEEKHRDTLSLRPRSTAAMEESAKGNGQSQASSGTSHTIYPGTEVPNPIWRLNEIGDLVEDLRLILTQDFACVYTEHFARECDLNPDSEKFCDLKADSEAFVEFKRQCRTHVRDRLWRESEYMALLFRRIPVDFPRLTRFALYIPAALYPNHDQTFIDRVLPGTGWTVRHYEQDHESVGKDRSKDGFYQNQACVALATELCPFVRRIFTRPTPTDDPSAVIIHNEEWHVTVRPACDLDGEFKSMDQLLTEPLRENYRVVRD